MDLKGEVVAKSGVRNVPLGHAVMASISDLCEKHRTGKSKCFEYNREVEFHSVQA